MIYMWFNFIEMLVEKINQVCVVHGLIRQLLQSDLVILISKEINLCSKLIIIKS